MQNNAQASHNVTNVDYSPGNSVTVDKVNAVIAPGWSNIASLSVKMARPPLQYYNTYNSLRNLKMLANVARLAVEWRLRGPVAFSVASVDLCCTTTHCWFA